MSIVPRRWIAMALIALLIPGVGTPPSHRSTTPDIATRARIAARYGDLPLAFEINRGQVAAPVQFLARGAGYSMFLTSTGPVLALRPTNRLAGVIASPQRERRVHRANVEYPAPAIVALVLAGANHKPVVEGLDPQPGKSHYLLGNDPARWHRNIARYGKVRYRQVYPGVDVIFYGNQRQLEYDFVVAPGIDPGQIRLAVSGVQGMQVDRHGDLVLKTGHGDLLQRKPLVYQEIGGAHRVIDGRYALLDNRGVGFAIGPYDTKLPLVIDPVLTYSTYLGDSGLDEVHGIAVDSAGNAYVTGTTSSVNFPASAAMQGGNAGGLDAFITKLNASGSALVYSTYLGGGADDVSQAIAVDGAGNAYVTGYTLSANFPTAAALQPFDGGGNTDAFVAKLGVGGGALVYSTYLGGTGLDSGSAIAVDRAGGAYVTGFTRSVNFPIAFAQRAFNSGSGDAFVSRFNASGNALLYSTYLGGTAEDDGQGIAVDAAGNAYITGKTLSANFPTTSPLQSAKSGGSDAFVAKLNPTGSAWIYSTFVGGNGEDAANGIAVDAAGETFIAGRTASTDFPTTAALQPLPAGGINDAFVSKLNANGSALMYSTYLGGNGDDDASSIAVDRGGNAVVTGQTSSVTFPLAAPMQTASDQTYGNAYVAQLNAAGSALMFSTYLGGTVPDNGSGIAVDPAGNAYVAGTTSSFDFPVVHALQIANAGQSDGFVAKIKLAPAPRRDFNGDGRDDILWRNHRTGANIIWKSAVSSTPQAMPQVPDLAWDIVGTGDFNGDGIADVLWRNQRTGVNAIWKSANWTTPQAVTRIGNLAWKVAGIGDFDEDGKNDILWRNQTTGANVIWKSANSATPQAVTAVSLTWQVAGVGDFNGDGKDDILWRNSSSGANVIWRSGNSATPQAVTGVTNLAWHVAAVGDFNGDRKGDILWRNEGTGANVIWKSAVSATPQAVTGVTNLDWHVVGAGDYTGDKMADMLWRNLRTGANVIWKSANAATQQSVTTVGDLAWVVEP